MLCFFNLAGAVYDPDLEGVEVATIDEARVLAAQNVGEVIRDRPLVVWAGEEIRLEVTDERQLVLFTIVVVGIDAAAAAGQPSSFRPVG
jgi:D-serine deaminase-like pyridoxal phosphate-dependent protein